MLRIYFLLLVAGSSTALLANPTDQQPPIDPSSVTKLVVDENRRITVNGVPVPHYPDFKPIFVSMPKPDYPVELRRLHLTGSGIFRMYIDARGRVEAIKICKSTGHRELDAEVVKAFSRWRAKPGPHRELDFPVTFSMWPAMRGAPPRPSLPARSKINVLHGV